MNSPLLVLDTNAVLDLLHFDDAMARPLRHALASGRVRCVVTNATLEELRRVLAYPEFELGPARQAALLQDYQVLSVTVETVAVSEGLPHKGISMPFLGTPIHYGLPQKKSRAPEPVWGRMPRCSDPDDQKFLELAAAVQAQGLVSKDRALLKLRRRCAPQFRIMTPDEAVRWLEGLPA